MGLILSNNVRTRRRTLGLSQEEVARRAGMSLKGMADIERGYIQDPHISSLVYIARSLETTVDALLEGVVWE